MERERRKKRNGWKRWIRKEKGEVTNVRRIWKGNEMEKEE